MNFTDKWETDEQGNKFVFTVEMQRRLHNEGLPVEPSSLSELPDLPVTQSSNSNNGGSSGGRRERKEEQAFEEPETIQIDPATGKYLGRLKWYNGSRGYGFIARGGGEDIFFHRTSSIVDPDTMAEGQWVLYDVEERKKGPEATEVEGYEGDMAGD